MHFPNELITTQAPTDFNNRIVVEIVCPHNILSESFCATGHESGLIKFELWFVERQYFTQGI